MSQLEILILDQNKLKNIDALTNLTHLAYLYLNKNELRDISILEKLGNLEDLGLADQKCSNNPIEYQQKLVVPNTIKGIDKMPITPNFISDNWRCLKNHVIWDLPIYVKEVSYKFGETIKNGEAASRFDGKVRQPLDTCILQLFRKIN
ncbi:Ig-like domain-containing protein [Listeria seeligeri]|uniref:Ig-like domain-containing protein n=1 Tax=Listeria seeligeri TaxID=1640 RepID=UPI0022EBF280|nr:Ig-like domain-containing protein [Listeria seeligeri]